MNLAEQLFPEVQREIQLLLNPGSNIYMPSEWGWGIYGWKPELLNDTTCQYTFDGYRKLFVRLDHVNAVDSGFTFGETFEAGSVQEERHTIDRILLEENDSFEHTYTFTFGALESELDAAKREFESEFSARVGEVYTGPAGAGFKQSLTEAYEQSVRKDTNHQETKSYHLAFKGPGGRLIEVVRRMQSQRRHISDNGYYDYAITIGHFVESPLKREVSFANKQEFLDVVRGKAALDKAMYNGRSWVPFYQGSYAQPRAEIDNVSASAMVSPQHTEVLRQDFVVSYIPFGGDGRIGVVTENEDPVAVLEQGLLDTGKILC